MKTTNENASNEKNLSIEVLFKRIIPWFAIAFVFDIIMIIKYYNKLGLGLILFLGYLIFCIPWIIETIVNYKRTHRFNFFGPDRTQQDVNGNYYTRNTDERDFTHAFKHVILGLVISIGIVIIIPYRVIRTFVLVVKK